MAGRPGRRVIGAAAAVVLVLSWTAATPAQEAELHRALGGFLQTKDFRVESVPDIYPGGYARISIYARNASLGGMIVDEVWFRLVGVTLDPAALQQGALRIVDYRDTSIHIRATVKGLQEYFIIQNAFKDIRLWSDGDYLYGEGTVAYQGVPIKVWMKGFFALGGTTDVYFYIDNLRVNGFPVLVPIIRKIEAEINPVLTQKTWPVTFKIRALRMTKEGFVVSSQADPLSPCLWCTSGDAPVVVP